MLDTNKWAKMYKSPELEFVIKQVGVGVLRRIRCKIGFAKKA